MMAGVLSRLNRAFGLVDRPAVEVGVGVVAAALLAAKAVGIGGIAFVALAWLLAFLVPGGGLVAVTLTVMTLPPVRVGGPVFDMRADEILAIGAVAGYGLRVFSGSVRLKLGLWKPVLITLAIMAVSVLVRYSIRVETPQFSAFYQIVKHGVRLALLASVAWLAWKSPQHQRTLRIALVLGGLFAAALAIGQYFSAPLDEFVRAAYPAGAHEAREFAYGRSFGPFEGNPNHLGAAMLLLSMLVFTWAERLKSWFARVPLVLVGGVYLAALAHSGSRAAFLVLLGLCVAYAVQKRWVPLAGSALGIVYTAVTPNALSARLPLLVIFGDKVRLGTSTAGKIAMLNPDYVSLHDRIITPVDSTYLDLLYNYGPVSLLAFLLMLVLIWRHLGRGVYHDDERGSAKTAAWAFVVLLVLGLNGPFFSISRVAEIGWILVGLGTAAAIGSRERLLDKRRVAMCSSVHTPRDPRIAFREARALAGAFDVHLYVNAPASAAPSSAEPVPWTLHEAKRPRTRLMRALKSISLVQRALADGAGTVIVHDPELLPWLVTMAWECDAVRVYDVHEDYVSMVRTKPWIPGPLRGAASWLVGATELVLTRFVDIVVVADAFLVSRFSNRNTVLVRNYPPAGLFAAGPVASTRAPGIVYVGGVTNERGGAVMVEAIRRVRSRVADATLTIVGRVPHGDAGDALAAEPGVAVVGELPYNRIAEHIAAAHVGLALLQDTPKHRRNVPSKLFDYMACGTPFVASDLPNIREATGGLGGLFVDPADVDAISDAIVRLLTDGELADALGQQGLAAVAEKYSFEAEGERLAAAIGECTA